MVHQSIVADLLADEDGCQRRHGPIEQLAILPIHYGRKLLEKIAPLLAAEVDLADWQRGHIGVDKQREQL